MAQWEKWLTMLAPQHSQICRLVDPGVVTLNADKLLKARGSSTGGLSRTLAGRGRQPGSSRPRCRLWMAIGGMLYWASGLQVMDYQGYRVLTTICAQHVFLSR